ncbi:MAG: LptF/LptG family permease [Elusimicrobia bacterium]|nr:LptF/LptG family permease [Elusimicrobiota bacterium]
MPIFARYQFRLFFPLFSVCLGVGTAVLLMNHFLRLFNIAVLKGISPVWIVACFARLLPGFLSLAVPMAFLVALLLVLGQLSESGEVMALRSSGFSFADILWPFGVLGLSFSLLLFYVNHKASPEAYHSFKKSYEGAVRQISAIDLEPRTFVELGEWKLFAQATEARTGSLGGIYLVKHKGTNAGLRVEAPEGRLAIDKGRGLTLELKRGTLQLPAREPAWLVTAHFDHYRLFMSFAAAAPADRRLDLQEMNTRRLRERLQDPELDLEHRKEYATEAAVRSVGAASPFVMFWLACPLGLRLEKRAKATGFALSLLVLFLYYGLLAFGISLGRRHVELAPWTPWIPNVAGLAGAALLWARGLRR